MSTCYLPHTVNPYGTLYNPLSIAQALADGISPVPDGGESINTQREIACAGEEEIVYHKGLYHSLSRHGSFSGADREKVRKAVLESAEQMRQTLEKADIVVITFGTAWVYEYEGRVVANCHKMPSSAFSRRRMSAEEIVAVWKPLLRRLAGKHFIFTVSPIRHIKDGLHENQISKSILLQSVEEMTKETKDDGKEPMANYFPSYEIMLDELRDYRFYKEDMLHPNETAIQYIWERFVAAYMSAQTRQEMQQLHQLYLDRHHHLLHPDTEEAIDFLRRLREREENLRRQYPWI